MPRVDLRGLSLSCAAAMIPAMYKNETWETLSGSLTDAMVAMGMATDAGLAQRVTDYLRLLDRWNGVYNLTAITGPSEMMRGHALDCMAIEPHVRGPRVLDVGTGAGLPGILLTMMHPEWEVVMLDSSRKKLVFVNQAIAELRLGNARTEHARVEDYRPAQKFDSVVCRAFSAADRILDMVGHLVAETGRVVMMKGRLSSDELVVLEADGRAIEVVSLSIPGLDAERHLLISNLSQNVAGAGDAGKNE